VAAATCSALASVASTMSKYLASPRAACPLPVAQSHARQVDGATDAMKQKSSSG
jgi:hypothetical protein